MPNESGWHRGDRVLYRVTGQRGIVEGWKNGKLLVYWGSANKQDYRDWVEDEDCQWEARPIEVIERDGSTEIILSSQRSGLSEAPL